MNLVEIKHKKGVVGASRSSLTSSKLLETFYTVENMDQCTVVEFIREGGDKTVPKRLEGCTFPYLA